MKVNILGIRGVPAAHGGFETFAAKLATYLTEKGHFVTVYCQEEEGDVGPWFDSWQGVERVHFKPSKTGPLGTIQFDWACVKHVCNSDGVDLVLGYNTAVFNVLQRLKRRKVVMNMDGIEWKREKWGTAAKAWFFINEVIGANLCSVAIADHPEIASHVKKRSFKEPVVIPYGADEVTSANLGIVQDLGLEANRYVISIARIEPENSILEMVQAFSRLDTNYKYVVLGKLDSSNPYHVKVKAAASQNVMFLGAIYDSEIVASLRFFAYLYLHGHQVGGTNPSLIEALGAGNAVLAHNNKFNRWVVGEEHFFFDDVDSLYNKLMVLLNDPKVVYQTKDSAKIRHNEAFQWSRILSSYEEVLASVATTHS